LLDAHPEWTPAEAKAALTGSAVFNPEYSALQQGAGRIDVAAALGTSFFASATSVSFGLARWPHEDDTPVTRTVTYRNRGPAAELTFEVDVLGPEGVRPPAGLFTVSPASALLPENGSVSVRITANTTAGASDGIYSGRLVASDGASRSLALTLAVNQEVESYDLTVRHLDRQGAPTGLWFSNLIGYENYIFPWVDSPDLESPQDVTLRLPKGRYAFESYIYGQDFVDTTRVVAPNQLLDRDVLLTMDGSAAAPMIIQPPREGLENLGVGETWAIQTDYGGFSSGLYTGLGETNVAFYQAEIDPRAPSLESEIDASWLDQVSTPQESHVAAWKELGRLPTPGTRSPSTLTPAVVHAIYAASLPQSMPLNEVGAGPSFGGALGASLTSIAVELPYERTEYYYSTESDARWWNELWMHDEEYLESCIIGWIPYFYEQGVETTTRWNQPVFSPVLPDRSDLLGDWGTRSGDVITIAPPMYGDREKHAGFIANEGTTTLYRNGELVEEQPYGDFGSFEVPPEPASYRVELQHSQGLFELTPRQSVAWTFESGHASEETPARLPLLVVRFAPNLDERGRAPSGAFTLPLYIDQFGRISSTLESAPSLEVSFDDGETWSTASLAVDGQRWNASLQHPASAAYVSLRTSARDLNGNAVEQTLIRAYAIGQD
ncbi:MAG TPA: hypothetical protein VNN80_29215, partial [Polyangiaceae bacterium]|nr:hypothetical protein [Polyangiaceae bacterium]